VAVLASERWDLARLSKRQTCFPGPPDQLDVSKLVSTTCSGEWRWVVLELAETDLEEEQWVVASREAWVRLPEGAERLREWGCEEVGDFTFNECEE
jgi:hypothetical protein